MKTEIPNDVHRNLDTDIEGDTIQARMDDSRGNGQSIPKGIIRSSKIFVSL